MRTTVLLFISLAACALIGQTRPDASRRSHNNRGAALMTQHNFESALVEFRAAGHLVNQGLALVQLSRIAEAERVFRQVIGANSDDARARYNLGLLLRSEGQLDEAQQQLDAVTRIDANDAFTHYFIATIQFQQQNYEGAAASYLRVIDLDPAFASAYFGASRAYTALQQTERASIYQDRFQALTRGSALNTVVGNQYGEQGPYAIAEELDTLSDGPATNIDVRMVDVTGRYHITAEGSAVCTLDFNHDGRQDLFVGDQLFENRGNRNPRFAAAMRLTNFTRASGCAVGDYDNDAYPDLLLSTPAGGTLYHNNKGQLTPTPQAFGATTTGIGFVDLDHDGWLDLVVDSRAFRNRADGSFADLTMPGPNGPTMTVTPTDYDNDRDIDLVVTSPRNPASVLSNNRDGTFSRKEFVTDSVADGRTPVVFDYDKDGWMDVFLTREGKSPVLLRNSLGQRFVPVDLALPPELIAERGAASIDFDNDGFIDLVFIARQNSSVGLRLLRNMSSGKFRDVTEQTQLTRVALRDPQNIIAIDLDDDGDMDLIITQRSGAPVIVQNDGGNRNGSLKLTLTGLKDNKLAIGTKVEIHGDNIRQKVEVASAAGPVLFGTGKSRVDFVRVLWPTGVVQDELPGSRSRVGYQEIDRKGSSCPTLYSWDGTKFRFITDVIGPAVIGEWVAPGEWNDSDTDEYVRLDPGAAQLNNGVYTFKMLSQMQEVTYLDALKLVVIDTPDGVEVYPNDRYQPLKPYPEFKLWQMQGAHAPVSVRDEAGVDLSTHVARIDGDYAPVPKIAEYPGFAQSHSIIIDVGPLARSGAAQLLFRGYTEYFDSTTAHSAYFSGIEPVVPNLEVADGHGGWIRKSDSIGLPAGLPKNMIVDLTQVFPSSDHRVRITNNIEIYWDQILVNTFEGPAPMKVSTLLPSRAVLGSAGYPFEVRKRPEDYDYSRRSRWDAFEIHSGNYTRYGDVAALMAAADDMYAIMASGDEMTADFDPASLPPLERGWHRTLLVYADGFEKAMETYTPFPNSVGPLPFHAMSKFPYPAGEQYPDDRKHIQYQLEYNTRHFNGAAAVDAKYRRQ